MKILHLISNDYSGRFIRDSAKGFADFGLPFYILTLEECSIPKWAQDIEVKDLQMYQNDRRFGILGELTAVARCLRIEKPDIIFCHLFKAGLVGTIVARLFKVPIVFFRHHITEHYESGTFLHRALDRLTLRLANHIVVCSRATRNWLIEMENVKSEKVTLIYQGFDFENLSVTDEELSQAISFLNEKGNRFNILCGVRYSRSKGQKFLLDAFRTLVSELDDMHLFFFGPGDRSWLEDSVKEMGLSNKVSLYGKVQNILPLFKAANVVVHPSLVDSFSQLIVEVQAVGGVLVATDIAAAREQIQNNQTGKIVGSRDSEALTAAIKEIYSSDAQERRFRKLGPVLVRKKFPLGTMIEQQLELASTLVNERDKGRNRGKLKL